MITKNTLCRSVNRKSFPSSWDAKPVAAAATAMFCRLIIFPTTPPLEFAAAIRAGFSPSRVAVSTWRFPNRALAEVSLPVRNTPNHPRTTPKNGNNLPVAAATNPSDSGPRASTADGMSRGIAEAMFVQTGEDEFVATEIARGPWDPNAQHGGAPASLLAHSFERLPGDHNRASPGLAKAGRCT